MVVRLQQASSSAKSANTPSRTKALSLMNGRTVVDIPGAVPVVVTPHSSKLHTSSEAKAQDLGTSKPRIYCEPDSDSVFFSDDHPCDAGGGGCL